MAIKNLSTGISQFAEDVFIGLSSLPKKLSSKYFYDQNGDILFQKIMQLEEYYLTACEYEILETYKNHILSIVNSSKEGFDLIELGAGDGYKTKILLEHFIYKKVNFKYLPVDISVNVLNEYVNSITESIPHLEVKGIYAEYSEALKKLNHISSRRKVVLFMGANIGNFSTNEVLDFLNELKETLSIGDLLIIGFDLKKDPRVILSAYNDRSGITKAFNFNLLKRINRELGGGFNLKNFEHYPTYCPVTGDTKSFLISTEEQSVFIKTLEATFHLAKWEPIQTEVSKKYDLLTISFLAQKTGFEVLENLIDKKGYFVDSIWKKI